MVGYATAFTMLPVFALVLDEDVDELAVFLALLRDILFNILFPVLQVVKRKP